MDSATVIVQARAASSRLPGKVLREVCGRPLLQHLVDRLRRAQRVGEIVVATTTNPADDAIVALTATLGVRTIRGSEDDVLARYHEAAREVDARTVVRVTADCPLLDPATVDLAIGKFGTGIWDYVSTGVEPVTYPNGLGCEVFSREALDRAHRDATARWDREHVTTYIKRAEAGFRCGGLALDRDLSELRVTVDTQEDLAVVASVFEALYPVKPNFGLGDVVDLLEQRADLRSANAAVRQKTAPTGERPTNLLFCVDAGASVGMGHAARCKTIARALPPGSAARFALGKPDQAAAAAIASAGFECGNADDLAFASYTPDIVVFDATHFGTVAAPAKLEAACREWRGRGALVVLIDGLDDIRLVRDAAFPIDMLVAPYAGAKPIDDAPFVQCIGTQFAVIDEKMRAADRPAPQPAHAADDRMRILVSLGGSDPTELTPRALRAVEIGAPEGSAVRVVVGPGFSPALAQRLHDAATASRLPVAVFERPDGLGTHLDWCDFAVIATGLTKYEAAAMGKPSIQVSLDRTHAALNRGFEALGSGLHLGASADVSDEAFAQAVRRLARDGTLRRQFADRGRAAVDGLGAARIVERMLEARWS